MVCDAYRSSEVDALVYDDPNPKFVSHMEAASGDLYAQPDKKSADSQGTYQVCVHGTVEVATSVSVFAMHIKLSYM